MSTPSSLANSAEYVASLWEQSIVPTLVEYIKIPNKSAHFDPQWREHGHMEAAMRLIESWCASHAIPGMQMEIVRLEDRGPVLLIEVPGSGDDTILLYGHMDKQPEMTGWSEGLGPWTPVLRGDRLYGRGGADDGYATFASLTALKLLREQGTAHARCVILIESGEESGSPDLPAYIEHLAARIGKPSLIVCLDSGCGDYERMWCTTSLRGMVGGKLTIEVLNEGVHSGDASGVVPSSFRIARQLLDRLEDATSGQVLLESCQVEIPEQRIAQAQATSKILGSALYDKFPFAGETQPVSCDLTELILNRTWRATLCVTGAEGLPLPANAGNVLRPWTRLILSLRLPPTCDSGAAAASVKAVLEANPPYGARVTFDADHADGWNAPALPQWLEDAASAASRAHFGHDAAYMGEGGSIPFMGMLGRRFPETSFLITGVLGPGSNAHGPNEFLDLPTAKKLTCCVADIIAAHHQRPR
jgi:acetylornithine deacetylase/succinyl-diaminopimelate desuccinylase-like protein